MRKFLIYFVVFLLVIILAAVISLRFFPKLYVSAFNEFSTEQQISAEQLDVNFIPLEVTIGNLGVINSEKATIVTFEKAKLSAQVMAWFKDKQSFWKASISNADVQLTNLPETSSDPEPDDGQTSKLNIHQILSGLNLKVDDVRVKIDEQQSIHLQRLYTNINNDALTDYKLIEQDIEFAAHYYSGIENSAAPLVLNGRLKSRYDSGRSLLSLSVPSLDLSPFEATEDAQISENIDTQPIDDQSEAPVDWSWLSSFEPLAMELDVGEVLWSKSSVKDIDLSVVLDQSIAFSFNSNIEWLESEAFSFKDTVKLDGHWKAISTSSIGADLRGESTINTSALNLKINGDVNVNGSTGNKLSVELDSTKVPVEGALDTETQMLVAQYFPIKAIMDIQQTGQLTELQMTELLLGDSDFKGQATINSNVSGPLEVKAQLESNLFSYKSLESADEQGDAEESAPASKSDAGQALVQSQAEQSTKSEDGKIFSDEAIDWSWLESLIVDFNWQAKQILVDDTEVNDIVLPVTVSDSVLKLDGFKALFGGGSLASQSTVSKVEEGVDIEFGLTASDVILEKLQLLPPEELKDGITDVSVALTTKGQSPRSLAQSLNGDVRINVGGGVIGNDSFELIGSDLILSLLNKLNPFSKKDKTTKLECAVVNLNIEKGKINIDNSLALRTSKLTMVADGYVDLSTEKIKLGLTPKARQGIGIDVSSLVKFIALGGTLEKPTPTVTASGLLKSAVVVGAAVSTGGVSLLATSAAEKTVASVDVCERATNAFK